jgi:hypothetical protein
LFTNEKDIDKRKLAVENLNSLLSKSEQTITSYELDVFINLYIGANVMQGSKDKKDIITWLSAFEKYIFNNEFMDEDLRTNTLAISTSMKIFALTFLLSEENKE